MFLNRSSFCLCAPVTGQFLPQATRQSLPFPFPSSYRSLLGAWLILRAFSNLRMR